MADIYTGIYNPSYPSENAIYEWPEKALSGKFNLYINHICIFDLKNKDQVPIERAINYCIARPNVPEYIYQGDKIISQDIFYNLEMIETSDGIKLCNSSISFDLERVTSTRKNFSVEFWIENEIGMDSFVKPLCECKSCKLINEWNTIKFYTNIDFLFEIISASVDLFGILACYFTISIIIGGLAVLAILLFKYPIIFICSVFLVYLLLLFDDFGY